MKKIISALILVSILAVPVVGLAVVAEVLPEYDVMLTLNNIVNWLFAILLIVAVLFLVIGGLQYVTAQGDPEKIKKAGQYILYALIGVIVALLARGLVTLVQKFMVEA